ncbi:MAG: DUF4405 domain-containing protein [Actinobacteria bacterium]|nr:DUF4405 domain-containing protein [Actinomycetota bacterium]
MSAKKNLVIDLIAFVSLLVVLDPRLTGIAVHEWLSIAFAALLVLHLLIHWTWLASATRRFLKAMPLTRWKFVLNSLIFAGFTIAMMSGFMVSESIIELFGMRRSANFSWREVHEISSNLTLLLTGIHVALNWGWLKKAFRNVLPAQFKRHQATSPAQLVPVSVSDNRESER